MSYTSNDHISNFDIALMQLRFQNQATLIHPWELLGKLKIMLLWLLFASIEPL